MDARNDRWIEFEHMRLESVRRWPESARKQATLKGILSNLQRISPHHKDAASARQCPHCRAICPDFAMPPAA